jgi:methylmalonyl-CoA/ethylmalonyl-CoA epimerase
MIQTLKLAHIGIAVRSIDQALKFYKDSLGLTLKGIEEVAAMKVKTAKLDTGNTILELIEPLPGEEAVTKFIEKRGEGIQHLCFGVTDIKSATQQLIAQGYKPVYPEPRLGAGGYLVNFLSPKDTFGVLIELTQQ